MMYWVRGVRGSPPDSLLCPRPNHLLPTALSAVDPRPAHYLPNRRHPLATRRVGTAFRKGIIDTEKL